MAPKDNLSSLVDFGSQGMGVGALQQTESEYMASSLDLFQSPPTEDTMLYSRESKYHPTGTLTDSGPFNFHLPSENSLFVDTSSIRLEGSVQIKKRVNGAVVDLVEADKVFLCNYWPHALFRSIEVSLNGVMVSYISSPASHYRAMIETLLSYGEDASKTHLRASQWLIDQEGQYEQLLPDQLTGVLPHCKRAKMFAKSAIVPFCTPLHSDILRLDKLLVDRMSMDINLSRERDAFALMTNDDTDYIIKIVDLSLHVRKIALAPTFVNEVNKRMDAGQRARYPLTRSVVKTRSIAKGSMYAPLNDLFSGRIPNTVIVGIVTSDAYLGNSKKNPFNFQNFDMNSVALMVNSKSYPAVRYTPNFKKGKYMREYRGFLDAIGVGFLNQGCLVTPERFHSGACLFAFDLTPDMCGNFHIHKGDRGSMSLEIAFGSATPEELTAIVFTTVSDEFQIDADRLAYSTGNIAP